MLETDKTEQLRSNFIRFYTTPPNPDGAPYTVFRYESNYNSTIKLPSGLSLVDETERLRKRIIHSFRIRGTAGNYMEQARQLGVFSAKKVDNIYEGDVGSIATYRVPTSDSRISSDEFLYLLQFTTTAALSYAMTHGKWGVLDDQPTFDENLEHAKRSFSIEHPFPQFRKSESLEVAACFEEPFYPGRQELIEKFIKKDLTQKGVATFGSGGTYFDPYSYQRINLWNQSLAPFNESRFNPKVDVQELSPVYAKIDKQEILEIIDTLQDPKSEDREFVEAMAIRAGLWVPPVEDSVLHIMGERVTLRLMDALQSWKHHNEPYLQYSQ